MKIFTTVGTLILEGSRLVFTEENHNVADAFASAGFPIEGGAHRSLLGLYELVGFFNALNDLDESFGRAQTLLSMLPTTVCSAVCLYYPRPVDCRR